MKYCWPRLLTFLIFLLGFVMWQGSFYAKADVALPAHKPEHNKTFQAVKGPRPPVDLQQVPENAYEPGILRIKLTPDMADKIPAEPIKARQDGYVLTGYSELDTLNRAFSVKRYDPLFSGLYRTNSQAVKNKARHEAWGFHLWFELTLPKDADIMEAVRQFQALDEVEVAEPEYKKQLIQDVPATGLQNSSGIQSRPFSSEWIPDDPRFDEQWHYQNTGQEGGTPGADISLPHAWAIEKGSSDVIVAIIDGGIDYEHEDLAGNMWDAIGYNFVDDTDTIIPHNHGTHVAGTVAAVNNNDIGVAGVAGGSGAGDGVRLMSCQVFTGSGAGGFHLAPVYAADNGAAISQNSWGYTIPGVYEQAVLDAIDYFNEHGGGDALDGGITIFAAGNDDDDGEWYPGYYEGAFSVAATNNQDQKSWYSNYGDWIDISAPGGETFFGNDPRGVLSTLNNNTYGFYQGTSMACPHASGVAALMISLGYGQLTAAQVADILRDTTDDHYGDNPDYPGQLGTGRLNALAALEETGNVLGPSGDLAGTVTSGGAPLPGVHIRATRDERARTTITGDDGQYSLAGLPVGTYNVEASKFAYFPESAEVQVYEDQTAVQNFILHSAPEHEVSGRISDDATGWPLYSMIEVAGYPQGPVWSCPVTGNYEVTLPEGDHEFTVTAWVDGYHEWIGNVSVVGGQTQDFNLQADMLACTAPGYDFEFGEGYREDFEADNGGYVASGTPADQWEWGTPVTWPNGCASGDKCWGTNLNGSYSNNANAVLTSPVIDLSAASAPLEVTWWQALYMESAFWDQAYAEVSINGGDWIVMWAHEGSTSQTDWTEKSYDLSAAAGGEVQFRFRIVTDSSVTYDGYYIDMISIGDAICTVPTGGLVVGNVYDENSQNPLVGATIEHESGLTTLALATPDDPNLDDAFYTIYSDAGTYDLNGSFTDYGQQTQTVNVPAGDAVHQVFQLPAGLLAADPESLSVTVLLGQTATVPLTLSNSGGLPVDFEIRKSQAVQPADFSIPRFSGQIPVTNSEPSIGRAPFASAEKDQAAGQSLEILSGAPAYAMDIWPGENLVYIPNTEVPGEWTIIANKPGSGYFAGDFINGDFESLYVLDYFLNELHVLATATGDHQVIGSSQPRAGESWTGMSGGMNGMMYASSTSISRSTLYTVNLDTAAVTEIAEITNAPCIIDIAVTPDAEMYGVDICSDVLVRIDPETGAGTVVGPLGFNANFAQGMDYEETSGVLYLAAFNDGLGRGELRIADVNTGATTLVGVFPDGAEVGAFAFATGGATDVPWLDVNPTSGTIAAGGSQTVTVTFDAGVEEITEPGVYQASLRILSNTPYGPLTVPVQMNVVEPTGYLQVYLSQEAIDAGVMWRIAGTDTWYYSGEIVELPVGQYIIEFSGGWRPEEEVVVTVEEGETTVVEVELTRAAALPGVLMLLLDDDE